MLSLGLGPDLVGHDAAVAQLVVDEVGSTTFPSPNWVADLAAPCDGGPNGDKTAKPPSSSRVASVKPVTRRWWRPARIRRGPLAFFHWTDPKHREKERAKKEPHGVPRLFMGYRFHFLLTVFLSNICMSPFQLGPLSTAV